MKVIFDTETTGLTQRDEILQFSAMDENGNVLLNTYIKPTKKTRWDDAAKINNIYPETVKDCKPFAYYKDTIQKIFDEADEIIAYNIDFDMYFLEKEGITFKPDIKTTDVMIEFAEIYGEWNYVFEDYKWQTLSTRAKYYHYKNFNAHDALNDVRATLYCYNKIHNPD